MLDTAAAYRTAIAEYIKVLRQRDGSFPDTLYIGRHAEFPRIELAPLIEGTAVRIVTSVEAESLKEDGYFIFLNIFGWITPGEVEFFMVRFQQGMRHWPDGRDDRHLRFSVTSGPQALVVDSVWK